VKASRVSKILLFICILFLSGYAQKRPALYPNAYLKQLGNERAQADIDRCMHLAAEYGTKSDSGKKVAKGAPLQVPQLAEQPALLWMQYSAILDVVLQQALQERLRGEFLILGNQILYSADLLKDACVKKGMSQSDGSSAQSADRLTISPYLKPRKGLSRVSIPTLFPKRILIVHIQS
jgi:hypothetical protein